MMNKLDTGMPVTGSKMIVVAIIDSDDLEFFGEVTVAYQVIPVNGEEEIENMYMKLCDVYLDLGDEFVPPSDPMYE